MHTAHVTCSNVLTFQSQTPEERISPNKVMQIIKFFQVAPVCSNVWHNCLKRDLNNKSIIQIVDNWWQLIIPASVKLLSSHFHHRWAAAVQNLCSAAFRCLKHEFPSWETWSRRRMLSEHQQCILLSHQFRRVVVQDARCRPVKRIFECFLDVDVVSVWERERALSLDILIWADVTHFRLCWRKKKKTATEENLIFA